jgi:hypothetical protein
MDRSAMGRGSMLSAIFLHSLGQTLTSGCHFAGYPAAIERARRLATID